MQNYMPLVSVCMPTFNHGLYLEEAILSIVTQNYPNIQLIISDDCSIDNTKDILIAYQQKYPDIIELQLHSKNIGSEKNIQSIYHLIKGDFVCWFSGDDLFLPNKITTQIKVMLDNPNCIFSFHDVNVIDKYSNFMYEFNDPALGEQLHTANITRNLLINRCFICANSIMINRKSAKNIVHRQDLGICTDWLLAIELSMLGDVKYIPEPFVAYRRHETNISNIININYEENVYSYLLQHYPKYKRDIYRGLAQLYCMYLFKYFLNKNAGMTLYCIQRIMVICVRSPINLLLICIKVPIEIRKRLLLFKRTGTVYR